MSLINAVKAYTYDLEQRGLLRTRRLVDPGNETMIYFDKNDYLSLSENPQIKEAYQKAYELFACGSGASMLAGGYHPNHYALERAFSQFLCIDECILFSSGYAANLAITALLGKIKAYCFIDKNIHASVYDGLALSQVNYSRFKHNNLADLALKVSNNLPNQVVLTEGIFSMGGKIAPLLQMYSLCQQTQSTLLIDEAHSFGVLGRQGAGAADHFGLTQKEIPLRVIPLGKACAGQGAVVAGNEEWIQALLQAGRSVIYSTAISPALSYGLLKALDILINADDRRLKLMDLIAFFRGHINNSPLQWADSDSAIQQLHLGCPHLALYYATELKKRGLSCAALRAPTVTTKTTGLRIVLNYNHQQEHIEKLFRTLNEIYDYTID